MIFFFVGLNPIFIVRNPSNVHPSLGGSDQGFSHRSQVELKGCDVDRVLGLIDVVDQRLLDAPPPAIRIVDVEWNRKINLETSGRAAAQDDRDV